MGTDDLFGLNPVLLPADAGAVRARRKLEQKISDERAAEERALEANAQV